MFKESLYNRIGLQFFADGGAAAGEGGTEGAQGTGSEGSNNAAGTKTFTQEQVNGMMANEKRSAQASLLRSLGYEVKDGKVQETLATIKGILDQGKTQQQLDQEARQKAEGDLASEKTRADNLQAQIDVMKAGVKAEYVEDAIALLSPRVTEDKPLSKLLEESKTKYPNWFSESGGSQGTGGSINPARRTSTTVGDMGKRLAQTNKSTGKSSFFKN